MEDLYKLLETRCTDVFEMVGTDSSHNKQAILARGFITFYFSKVSNYLNKVFGTGFDLDWNYTDKDNFYSMFSYISDVYGKTKIGKLDGVQYYFKLAKNIWDYLTSYQGLKTKSIPFENISPEFIKRAPETLCNARLYRSNDMTMAGLIYFISPMVSVNDRYRLIDDVTRIFAKDISFYQGENCDELYQAVMVYFPKSTIFSTFKPFFKSVSSNPLEQLKRIMFTSKHQYGLITQEGENRYSYSLDLSSMGVYQPLVLKGTINDNGDSFEINIDPVLSKYDIYFEEEKRSLTIDKDVLPELVKYAQRIPPFVLPLALTFFFREGHLDEEAMRALGPSFFIFQSGSYYYEDRERADIAYKPMYRVGYCVPSFILALNDIYKKTSKNIIKYIGEKNIDIMKRLKTTSVWMNKLWKYDMILGGEFFDDDGNLISITTTDIAQILSDLNFLYQTFPTEFENDVIYDYGKRGINAYMTVLVTKKYANYLETSKKILEPLNLSDKDWRATLDSQEENSSNYLPAKLITDEAMQELSSCKPTLDTWLCDAPNGMELSSARYVTNIIKAHIVSNSGSILIKGKDTGKSELTLYTLNQTDLNGITGKDGTPITVESTKKEFSFLTSKEMKC